MEEDTFVSVQSTLELLRTVSEHASESGRRILFLSTKDIRVAQARKGFLLCHYIVPNGVADENGNWHAGAIATLIDNISTVTTYSYVPVFNVSVDFSISIFSAAKVQEEIEVEAKVVGKKERLTCVAVQIRKKGNGRLIALGKQWMATTNTIASHQAMACTMQ
ncbi:uncharacterized protein LOC114715415 isoform X3 [Neltuma alba]|uniref:uncharacterized protein LOC114715415 isoform X3 n=1 Tax=Neltuma alba TaxID=207710 RepID=UPI0010A49C98|nr:uncharacterized protein LOC114715415 isoform X3 [Prosopis alba]